MSQSPPQVPYESPAESKGRTIVTQTIALFIDAYRELNAKRLFWIVLIISLLIAAGFGAVGINQNGFIIFWKEFPSTVFSTVTINRAEIYKWMFAQLGVNWWLTLIATILALVSTAGIFPEFISGGAIDLYLSKPIGRLRLFCTKYLAGLIFVALQVLVFCIAAFFVIGLRGGVWEPAIFVAVPLVLLFFSYLFAVQVLLGILTRSAIAALLLTILIWVGIFAFHSTEVSLLVFSTGTQIEAQVDDHDVDQDQKLIDHLIAGGAHVPSPASTQPFTYADRQLQMFQSSLVKARQDRAEVSDPYATWHRLMFAVTYPLPKTTETVDLIKRVLGEHMHIRHHDEDDEPPDRDEGNGLFRNRQLMHRAGMQAAQIVAARSQTYILGTSLGFEALVLTLAAWLFCRRDY